MSQLGRNSDIGKFEHKQVERVFKGKGTGKKHFCACCGIMILNAYRNSTFCRKCKAFIQKIVCRYNQRLTRVNKELKTWKELGSVGRIKQKLEWNELAVRKMKNLRDKERYHRNQSKKYKGQMGEVKHGI